MDRTDSIEPLFLWITHRMERKCCPLRILTTMSFGLLCSLTPTSAQIQGSDGDQDPNCHAIAPTAPTNRTDTVEFHLDHDTLGPKVPFYLTQEVRDGRPLTPQSRGSLTRSAWLSVPESFQGQGCVYTIVQQNSTPTSTDLFGCDGILSAACVSSLRGSIGSHADG